ncbi:hypothetical protein [Undibacterium terreum]|uniref:Uncharacterized protein n=1 Tax=Undibacterium terreum TaxID=1224302 RepID=A0A916XG19_9BURK|nr:hypothetical protein [Undibacterium terreum]GGC70689.1 hypothetical protein GCM10011396_17260 [Undibacterium terreum]
MKTTKLLAVLLSSLFATAAFAQTAGTEVQRDVNQQQRIENGLKSGQLSTREAAKLEREEKAVDKTEARALKDGKLSQAEKNRIQNMQNKVSSDIHADKTNAQTGNPNSASSRRMQADVQRNVNQEQRVENGVKGGSLTNHEVAKLERGQAKVDGQEFQAGKNGHVSAGEQRKIQRDENKQSRHIHKDKNNDQIRG